MKLSVLIARLQDESKHCKHDPEVMLMIGGRKPDEAELVNILGGMEGVHCTDSYPGDPDAWIWLLADTQLSNGPPWWRSLRDEEEERRWWLL